MKTGANRISLKELYKQCISLNEQYTQTRNRYYLYAANLLHHKYVELGGRRLVDIHLVRCIGKTMDLRRIYNKETFNNKQKFSSVDDIVRYLIYTFWKNKDNSNIKMFRPKVVVKKLSNGYSVEIVYQTIIDDHVIIHEVNEGIIEDSNGVDVTVLMMRLLEETHTLFGGTEASFQHLQRILAEYGSGLIESVKVIKI